MSEFFKLAYDLISRIIYNLAAWVTSFFAGFVKVFITGWTEYVSIFLSYFSYLAIPGKVLAVLLAIVLIAIPIVLIAILVRKIIIDIQLRAVREDNKTLYREIGRLNREVLQLMDEKSKILSMKVNTISGGITIEGASAEIGSSGPSINVSEGSLIGTGAPGVAGVPVGGVAPVGGVVGGGIPDPLAAPVPAVGMAGGPVIAGAGGGGNIDEDALTAATAAAVTAAAEARARADEADRDAANRFPKLSLVDAKYAEFDTPDYDNEITLEEFVNNYRLFAASQMHLYYTPEIIRRFVAGMAASHLLILEGISGTGKTSLPYSFSRYLNNPATLVSVQPSFRDRTELLGYFNEFSKRFNETEFLRALYEANYREDPSYIVLDEMNLARIEYYFAEMLSVLELPSVDEWTLDLVPTAWPGDPQLLDSGKIHVSPSTWFVGTANNDDSTFTITDKVYDRAIPIELNERADAFTCDLTPSCHVTAEHLMEMFARAKEEHPINESTLAKLLKLDQYLQTRFKLAFGNRIMKQMYDFVPVYVACGGTELDAMDYIIARKVLKKFESMNVAFVRDEIKGLIAYIEKSFGKNAMQDSKDYLTRIQNLY